MAYNETVAIIDIGSNSVHLLVAQKNPLGGITPLAVDKHTIRLGSDVIAAGKITPEGKQRLFGALKQIKSTFDSYTTESYAIATEAIRQASNSSKILSDVFAKFEIDVEIISGRKEAELIGRALQYKNDLEGQCFTGIDIGGASTEIFTYKNNEIEEVVSIKIGAVTLDSQFNSYKKMEYHIDKQLAKLDLKEFAGKDRPFYATAGTAKAIARSHRYFYRHEATTNGYTLTKKELSKILNEMLKDPSPKSLAEDFDVSTRRSEVIIPGAILLYRIANHLNIKSWKTSTAGLKDGAALDYFYS